MSWTIEPVTSPDEIDDVMAIEHESFTNPWTREMHLAEQEHRSVAFCYLARGADGAVAGFCSFWRVVDELHINNLAVRPSLRRRGVASALLRHILAEGARRGAIRATLEVRRSNEAARVLYERFGFSVSAVRHDYYTHPVEDALVLWRQGLA
ncbi:MAG TPA: ribosomal protein S18-alanine N-acetyltransferase [Vicinamibacterales bacterium]|nr:ribosomal protein S18-alanine N-acetyltransferase [Vicinamibacterales bacterium]